MRILHVIGDSAYGGGSRIILAIATGAAAAGHEVQVLTTDPRFQSALADAGITVVDRDWVRRRPGPVADVRGVWSLARWIRRQGYDVVHTHTTRGGLLGRLAATLARAPAVIHTAHGFAVAESDGAAVQRAYFAFERLAARWCHHVVAVSEHHRRWAATAGVRPRVDLRAISNGVPDASAIAVAASAPSRRGSANIDEAEPASSDLGRPRPTVLHHGRIAPGKGIDRLLVAFHDVLDVATPPPRLQVAGDGPSLASERSHADELGLDDDVQWLGYRDDIATLLASADVVVLPSLREGLSLAVLETMAAGRPIVASALGGNIEALADGACGVLVPPGDTGALSEAILGLLAEPGRAAELGRTARERYLEAYREDLMVARYLALYDGALGSGRGAGGVVPRTART